jgi:hypothetical protein
VRAGDAQIRYDVGFVEERDLRPRCCICGRPDNDANDVRWCEFCRHYFCAAHRWGWPVWERGKTALREWLTGNPPRFCDHDGL